MIHCQPEHLEERCRERGYTLEEVMPCVVSKGPDGWVVDESHPQYPREKRCLAGTELKGLLSLVGIQATPNCTCNAKARAMDELGCQWCMDNIDQVVTWLEEEAKARGLPCLRAAAKAIVALAIRRAASKANVRLNRKQVHK